MTGLREDYSKRIHSLNYDGVDFDNFDDSKASSDKSSKSEKEYSITKINAGLNLYAITLKNPSANLNVKKMIQQMNKYTNEKTDIIRLSASFLPERNLPKTVSYENTECKFICNEETVVINETNATELNVGIKHPDKYYYLNGEDARFPVELLFAVDDKTYTMFQTYEQVLAKHNSLKHYAKLTASQRDFFIKQFNRPKKTESKNDESIYTPIRDEKALKVLYETCKDTYSESTRAKVKLLFSELNSSFSNGDKFNVINQLSHILGIDTQLYPYKKKSFDEIIAIMDKYIYGLDDFKESFAEFLLAMQFSDCSDFATLLVGPPGVGKTSIGSVIAECCDKPLIYIDCSGSDVIAMSGLVKSYSGAKAGKVIDGFWEAGRSDAVVLCDEIDKLSVTKEGNPYSIFLKALGPQKKLYDQYVDEDIDVSNSIFICTANDINDIPGYIVNRFGDNIFYLDKYSAEEKVAIATNHIIPSILASHRIDKDSLLFTDEALMLIARDFCNDEGMREMSGYIKTLVRKVIRIWSENQDIEYFTIDEAFVMQYLKKKKTKDDNHRKMGF